MRIMGMGRRPISSASTFAPSSATSSAVWQVTIFAVQAIPPSSWTDCGQVVPSSQIRRSPRSLIWFSYPTLPSGSVAQIAS